MKNIEGYIKENNIKLLGEIETQEEDFEYLKQQLTTRTPKDGETDLNIALEFVRFAIKYYDDKFWPLLYEKLEITPFKSNKQTDWGKLFLNTIRKNELPFNKNITYVENIKLHTIVPNYRIEKYCEFLSDCYQNFFKDSIEDRDEFKESLEKLANNIKAQLNNNKEEISSGESNKSYTLLIASRRVFAEVEIDKLTEIFYPIFRLIDDFYSEKDITPKTRLQKSIYEYLSKLDVNQSSKGKNINFKKTPYIKINYEDPNSLLCFPKGGVLSKYIKDSDKKELMFNIIYGKNNITRNESIKKYFDNYIYDSFESFILNTDIFEEIKIEICTVRGEIVKEYIIPKSNYRIFDSDGKLCKSIHQGNNFLITKKGMEITPSNAQVTSDTQYYTNWDYHTIDNVTQDSILKIGNDEIGYDILCLNSVFNQAPQFDSLFNEIKVKKEGIDIPVSRKHPIISFAINQELFDNTYVTINNDKKLLTEIKDIQKTEINDLYLIKIPLENILNGQYGFFNIHLITERHTKSLIEYVVFHKDFFHFEQSLYVEEYEAKLYIKGFNIINNNQITDGEYTIISIPLTQDEATFDFISNNQKLSINIPIPIFKYGNSINHLKRKTKNDSLWYKDKLCFYIGKHSFIVRIPDENIIENWKEISNIKHDNYFHTINLDGENNNKSIIVSNFSLKHPTISISRKNKLEVFPQKLSIQKREDNSKYIKIDKIIGKEYAKLVVDIKNHDTGEFVYKKHELKEGINELPILSDNCNYDLYPFMREGFIDTPLDDLGTENITPLDIEQFWILKEIQARSSNGIIQTLTRINDTKIEFIRKEPSYYRAKLSYLKISRRNNQPKPITYNAIIKIINKQNNKLYVSIKVEKYKNKDIWIYPYFDEEHHFDNRTGSPFYQLNDDCIAVLELPNKENK